MINTDRKVRIQMNREEFISFAKKDLRQLKREHMYSLDFVVKRKQRLVYAYYQKENGVFATPVRGKAECKEGDTFNEFIGCAIAARRALGLTLDAYMDIPSCTTLESGSILRHRIEKTHLIYAEHGLSCRLIEPLDSYVTGRLFSRTDETLLLYEVFDDTCYIDELEDNYMRPNLQRKTLSCYDRKNHTCNLSCQGSASSCPIVISAYKENSSYPTKKEMAAYIKEQRNHQKAFQAFFDTFDFEKLRLHIGTNSGQTE